MLKVCIDIGHGGRDPGSVANGLKEKDITLKIGMKLRDILASEYTGIKIMLTRDRDVTKSLAERTKEANRWGADCLVSIHVNAGGGTGWEIFIYNGKVSNTTKKLQSAVHSAVRRVLEKYDLRDRGKKQKNLHMLRESRMPAILTENLFIDHVVDAKLLKDNTFIENIARAHAEGIANAFGLKKGRGNGSHPKRKSTKSKKRGDYVVEHIQRTIIERYGFKIAVDGLPGPETIKALLMGYQTELNRQFNRNLIIDGIWGPKTEAATVNVKYGARGNLTWIMQALLYIRGYYPGAIDSIYGKNTRSALRRFQSHKGLTVDGIAGKQTWRRLFRG